VQGLPERVGVPGRARAGLEGDGVPRRARRCVRAEQRVDADGAGEPLGRPLRGRLRTASPDLHRTFLSGFRIAAPSGRLDGTWRVHFHVPIVHPALGAFASTQDFLAELLAIQRRDPISSHLEVETYTWDVLPPELRDAPIADAIARELRWVIDRLRTGEP
jgi:hypothetical protein